MIITLKKEFEKKIESAIRSMINIDGVNSIHREINLDYITMLRVTDVFPTKVLNSKIILEIDVNDLALEIK